MIVGSIRSISPQHETVPQLRSFFPTFSVQTRFFPRRRRPGSLIASHVCVFVLSLLLLSSKDEIGTFLGIDECLTHHSYSMLASAF